MATKLKSPHAKTNAAIAVMVDSVATITVKARRCGTATNRRRDGPARAVKIATT
jgi:hypothetical protein